MAINPLNEKKKSSRGKANVDAFLLMQHIILNLLLFILFANFAYQFLGSFISDYRYSSLILFAEQSIVAFFFLIRRREVSVSKQDKEVIIANISTILPFFFLPVKEVAEDNIALMLQIIGYIITFLGVLSLNRSIGIIPADRGIQTNFMYKFVRHPLYLGYVLSNFGFAMSNINERNILLLAVSTALFILRIKYEERHLNQNPTYQKLTKTTKYKLLPYIW